MLMQTGQGRCLEMHNQRNRLRLDSCLTIFGPTSQDFQVAFELNGDDEIHISSVDAQGIAWPPFKV